MRSEHGSNSTAFSTSGNLRNNATIDQIYIGGYPEAAANFSGVMSNFAINGEEKNFWSDPAQGINVVEADRGVCTNSTCMNNGTCLE